MMVRSSPSREFLCSSLIDNHFQLAGDSFFISRIARTARRRKIKCLSFDVFDTCVLRKGVPEIERFLILAELVKEKFDLSEGIKSLARKRIFAHHFQYGPIAASGRNNFEPSDIDIYKHYASLIPEFNYPGLPLDRRRSLAGEIADCEVQMEISVSEFSPLIVKFVEAINPEKIIFISDMYLASSRIKSILMSLDKYGLANDSSEVYVSNEMNCSKSSGLLYTKVLNEHLESSCQVMHFGDNKRSDAFKALDSNVYPVHLSMPVKEVCCRSNSFLSACDFLDISNNQLSITL